MAKKFVNIFQKRISLNILVELLQQEKVLSGKLGHTGCIGRYLGALVAIFFSL